MARRSCARLSSTFARERLVSRTPRICVLAGWAWHAALEQAGWFSMGVMTPSTRDFLGLVHAKTVGALEQCRGFDCSWHAVTSLSIFVYASAHFVRRGRVADDALRIHDADPHHARLVGHVDHHFVQAGAVVLQHVMRGAATQHLALLLGADQGSRFQVLAVQPDAEIIQEARRCTVIAIKIDAINLR